MNSFNILNLYINKSNKNSINPKDIGYISTFRMT